MRQRNVDEYILQFTKAVQGILQELRRSVQFPIDKPMPLDLVRKIVEFRVSENKNKAVKKIKAQIALDE